MSDDMKSLKKIMVSGTTSDAIRKDADDICRMVDQIRSRERAQTRREIHAFFTAPFRFVRWIFGR